MSSSSPGPSSARVIQAALRSNAAEWIRRFYRHEVLVARAVKGVQDDAVVAFRREVIQPVVRALGAGLATFTDRGADVRITTNPQLRKIIADAEAYVRKGIGDIQAQVNKQLADIAKEEVDWAYDSAAKALKLSITTRANSRDVWEMARNRPYLGGQLDEWFDSFTRGDNGVADNIKYAVQTGVQRGWSTDEMVRSLRGSKASNYSDGLLSKENVAQLNAIVRTAATHVSTAARQEAFGALGVKKWRFIAVLDNKTSIVCAANDGKVFDVGKGPLPPLHPNCRSTAVPYIGPPVGTRATVDGPVDADTTFETWLEDQPESVQDEVLGRARAQAWRSGSLSLDDMINQKNMQALTLDQLRKLDLLNDEDTNG